MNYCISAKREHKKTWNNPQMYLRSGTLGPYYMLHNFKATGELDNANLKTLKVAGMLKYKVITFKIIIVLVVVVTVGEETTSDVWSY